MEVKGRLRQQVWIKRIISEIHIDESGTRYVVEVSKNLCLSYMENELVFQEEAEKEDDHKKVNPIEEIIREPVDSLTVKKRGRPKKATVEDLIKRAKESGDD